MDFCFHMTAMDIQQLLPQVSRGLERHTELRSRAQYPGLWDRADALRAEGRKPRQRNNLIRGLVYLVLGVFLLVPGLQTPRQPLLLFAGGLATLVGVLYLWLSRNGRLSRFDRSAAKLLAGKDTLAAGEFQVTFSTGAMTIRHDDATEAIAYSRFHYVLETESLWMPIFDGRVLLLQKQDLDGGDNDAFRQCLTEQTKVIPVT